MIWIDGNHLALQDVVRASRFEEPVGLDKKAYPAILQSKKWLDEAVFDVVPVYGINTGFGLFKDQKIPLEASAALSRNLILSHAVATGAPLPGEVVRAAMLVRANTLAKGYSGVRVEIIETLLEMLNRGITPVVPSQGSLGSSGDLSPLSHLALVFTTDERDREEESGWAQYQGGFLSGKQAMAMAGIPRLILGPKEGLALNNGATFSAALGVLAVSDGLNLLRTAEISLALSLEALVGCSSAFDPRLHEARGQTGQMTVASHIRSLIEGSTLIDSACRVQDAYSIRCAPQVQGAALDAVEYACGVVEKEINAATDNPLFFGPGEILSGGNFHGEPVGMAMDFFGIAMAEVAAISERRIFRLIDGRLNDGLPPMLVDQPEQVGLNSGLMMPQYTAASLVLENVTLAAPDTVHSLPTSGEQEDHNANSMTAARHARQILENTAHVLAIELYTAARALDLRLRFEPDLHPGPAAAAVHRHIREVIPYHANDTWWAPEIEAVRNMVTTGELAKIVPLPSG